MPRDPVDEFKALVHAGDAQGLRALLQSDASVRAAINEPIFAFDSPAIREVSSRADTAVLDVLLECGADPNRMSDWWAGGFHPLYNASPAAAERLIAAGARIDACAAASLDRLDVLERIVEASPLRVHERGGDGQTPLHFARSTRVADFLLSHGADIDARCIDHRSTPAEWMLDKRPDLARYLVDRGAYADVFMCAALGLSDRAVALIASDPALMSLRTSRGEYAEKPPSSYHIYEWTIGSNMTPLQVAAKFGNAATTQALLAFASPAQRLLFACHHGNRAEALQLVNDNPGLMDSLSADDRRALSDEAWAANLPAVELLLELGFDPALPASASGAGGTALHCAAWEGSAECVAAILRVPEGRALVNAVDDTYHGVPLGWCGHGSVHCGRAGARHEDVARLLIEAGATIPPDFQHGFASDAVRTTVQKLANSQG